MKKNDFYSARDTIEMLTGTLEEIKTSLELSIIEMFKTGFEQCWKEFIGKEKNKVQKVKKNFAYALAKDIFELVYYQFPNKYNLPLPEIRDIVGYVFEFHHFKSCRLTDEKRAELQKNDNYKKSLKREIVESLYRKAVGVKHISIATQYNPEICTCDFLCDSVLRVLNNNREKVLGEGELDDARFVLLANLYIKSFFLIKNIILQLTKAHPFESIISLRMLLELEYKALVLNRYDYNLSKLYEKFEWFSVSNENDNPNLWKEYEQYARCYKRKTEDLSFRNYGWLLGITDKGKLSLTFKSLLQICGDEERYKAYQSASQFVHVKYLNVPYTPKSVYEFLLGQINWSINNLLSSMKQYFEYYQVKMSEEDNKELDCLSKKYFDTYAEFVKNIKKE